MLAGNTWDHGRWTALQEALKDDLSMAVFERRRYQDRHGYRGIGPRLTHHREFRPRINRTDIPFNTAESHETWLFISLHLSFNHRQHHHHS